MTSRIDALRPTERFSDRVSDYIAYRPDYPEAMLGWLEQTFSLSPPRHVADVGGGTGLSAKLFLDAGYRVTLVEPNAAMREGAAAFLNGYETLQLVEGRAEATTLPDASVDLVCVAQAFHWFDQDATREEFRRILRPEGLVLLCWNSRLTSGSPFLDGYEHFLHTHGTDYIDTKERYATLEELRAWFQGGLLAHHRFDHAQRFDRRGLRGRTLSSSFIPRADSPRHQPMLDALDALFDDTAEADGKVSYTYDTNVYVGRLHA